MSKERLGHKHVICANIQPPLGSHWPCRGGDCCWGPVSHNPKFARLAQGSRVEAWLLRRETWLWTCSEEPSGRAGRGGGPTRARRLGAALRWREALHPDVTQGFLGWSPREIGGGSCLSGPDRSLRQVRANQQPLGGTPLPGSPQAFRLPPHKHSSGSLPTAAFCGCPRSEMAPPRSHLGGIPEVTPDPVLPRHPRPRDPHVPAT